MEWVKAISVSVQGNDVNIVAALLQAVRHCNQNLLSAPTRIDKGLNRKGYPDCPSPPPSRTSL